MGVCASKCTKSKNHKSDPELSRAILKMKKELSSMQIDIETLLITWKKKKGVMPQNINEIDKILKAIQTKKTEVETIQTVCKEDEIEMHSKQEKKKKEEDQKEDEEDDKDENEDEDGNENEDEEDEDEDVDEDVDEQEQEHEDEDQNNKQKKKKNVFGVEDILILGTFFLN